MEREREKDLGAMWCKQSAKGGEFLSGYVEIDGRKVNFVAFCNSRKPRGSKQPDWRILPARDQAPAAKRDEEQDERPPQRGETEPIPF